MKVYYKPSVFSQLLDALKEAERKGKEVARVTFPRADYVRLVTEMAAAGTHPSTYFTIPIEVEA